MKIPMKVDYGVRALVELALHYGEGPVQTAEIAYKQGIPEAYLDQLMTTLHKFGFVSSRRGPQGRRATVPRQAGGAGSCNARCAVRQPITLELREPPRGQRTLHHSGQRGR